MNVTSEERGEEKCWNQQFVFNLHFCEYILAFVIRTQKHITMPVKVKRLCWGSPCGSGLFSFLIIYCKCLILTKRISKSLKWAIRVLFLWSNLTVVKRKDPFHNLSLLQQRHHSPFWGVVSSTQTTAFPVQNTSLSISWTR